jgi:hypothetical protein
MKKHLSYIVAAALLLSSMPSHSNGLCAPIQCELPTGGEGGSRTDNRVYAGLSWELGGGQGLMPSFQLGFRTLRVKSSDSVNGADISLRIKYDRGLVLDSTRLVYVGGNRDVQGNLGLGYSFVGSGMLATAAIQGPYLRLGTDFMFGDKSFKPYVELNSLAKPDKVAGALSCAPGYTLVNANDVFGNGSNFQADPSVTINGKTCRIPFA